MSLENARVWLIPWLLGLCFACGDTSEANHRPGSCKTAADCGEGKMCIEGFCRDRELCVKDTDCGECLICQEHICVSGLRAASPAFEAIAAAGDPACAGTSTPDCTAEALDVELLGSEVQAVVFELVGALQDWRLDKTSSQVDSIGECGQQRGVFRLTLPNVPPGDFRLWATHPVGSDTVDLTLLGQKPWVSWSH